MRPGAIPELVSAFGAEVKAARVKQGLTQEDLAALADIDRPYLTALEAGRKQPSLSTIYKTAVGLGLTPGALLDAVERRFRTHAKVQTSSN